MPQNEKPKGKIGNVTAKSQANSKQENIFAAQDRQRNNFFSVSIDLAKQQEKDKLSKEYEKIAFWKKEIQRPTQKNDTN